ncbi:MAG TPA: DUF5715 family protein, partial [Blastocatellia bacterium]|nr:DUF5715 family protein [Blastocatellia bacterium]
AEFEAEHNRLAETVKQYQSDMKLVRAQLRKASRRERQLRAELRAKLAATQKAIAEANKEARLLASFYKSPVRRKLLEAKYEQVAKLAADFEGQAYNLQEADDRKRMKARLLSYVRPEARDALTEIAQAYKGKFDRWLPITSLVRTEEYQRQLSRTNRNATRIETPPHATGLAFDIYNRHMTAAEQDFLMAEIARMEAAGRLEALRENRDHIHVFVFPEGHPPDEALITNSIKNLNSPASFKPSAGKERNHKTGEADLRAGR